MDPAERAFHQYLKSLSDGTVTHSFARHLELALQDTNKPDAQLRPFHPFLAFGLYTEQVRRYVDHFPARQLSISLYEDSVTNYREWFTGLLSFLGVDTKFVPPEVDVPSKPHIPRFPGVNHALKLGQIKRLVGAALPSGLKSYLQRLPHREDPLPTLPTEDRARLVAYYRKDILRLEDLIQRDLSAWLS
jgi:hypothetical protein